MKWATAIDDIYGLVQPLHVRQIRCVSLDNECLTNWHCMAAEDVKRDIVDFIEVFYNSERLHSHTGYLCSNKYEALVKTLV
jgi:hypothetical protein